MKRVLSAMAIVALTLLSGCGDDAPAGDEATGVVLLSLGDSIAAGNGASDPDGTSFAALVARDLDLELENLAVAGKTTREVIDEQLPQAAGSVRDRAVGLITISAGGNDLAALIPNASCVEDPLPQSCPLEATLGEVATRLDAILSSLRSAYPDAAIVLLAYPNFFSGTGHAFDAPAERVLPRLGERMREVAGRHDRVGVAAPAFDGRGGELTHVLDAVFDPHPNDAGHRIIADAVIEAATDIE